MRRSVIDVGSNSVLLLVSELREGTWVPICEETAITALGEGTKITGLLGLDAMTRTLAAVKKFSDLATTFGVSDTVIGATMAARIATNSHEFLSLAADQRTPIVVLSGEVEAELGFAAVVDDPVFSGHSRISIVDPGGQSTEVVIADRIDGGWKTLFKESYSVGTLGLKSGYMPDERVSGIQVLRASGAIDDTIGILFQPNDPGVVVVLGAAGTNLVSIRDELATWLPDRVHGSSLSFEEISNAVGQLMPLADPERAAIVGMEPGREKTIHVGALLLERFLFALRAEDCLVSVRGWRHALLEKGGP